MQALKWCRTCEAICFGQQERETREGNKRGKQERERERERGGWGTHMVEYHPPYTGGVATLPLPSQSVSAREVGHKLNMEFIYADVRNFGMTSS